MTESSREIKPARIASQQKKLRCPPDKSITHRAFLFSLFSSQTSRIEMPLLGEDCLASLNAVKTLGATVNLKSDSVVEIAGFGLKPFAAMATDSKKPVTLDCQNSGTTMRLLSGILCGQNGFFRLIGDSSLTQRPMARIAKPLSEMNAKIFLRGDRNTAPIDFEPPATPLIGKAHELQIASAQVKSALLLAGLWCELDQRTEVVEPTLSRDHTENMLTSMGVNVERKTLEHGKAWSSVVGHQGRDFAPIRLTVPGDPSSAAFWASAALLQQCSLIIDHVLLNPTRLGFVHVLKRMGARIKLTETAKHSGEPVGTLEIERVSHLSAVEVLASEVPSLVDEIPILAVTALWAEGTSVFHEVQELRVKESDRLLAVVNLIKALRGNAWVENNILYVEGCGGKGLGPTQKPWTMQTQGDHRLAMTAVITADVLNQHVILDDADCIKVSYPDFFKHREELSQT